MCDVIIYLMNFRVLQSFSIECCHKKMKRQLLLFRMRLAFSFSDIQELLNVQNSLDSTRQQTPKVLSEGNETSMEGLLRTGRLCSVTMFVVPFSY